MLETGKWDELYLGTMLEVTATKWQNGLLRHIRRFQEGCTIFNTTAIITPKDSKSRTR
jgi:hypothetical protein